MQDEIKRIITDVDIDCIASTRVQGLHSNSTEEIVNGPVIIVGKYVAVVAAPPDFVVIVAMRSGKAFVNGFALTVAGAPFVKVPLDIQKSRDTGRIGWIVHTPALRDSRPHALVRISNFAKSARQTTHEHRAYYYTISRLKHPRRPSNFAAASFETRMS